MPYIPEELKLQLKPGGRLIAPVGAGEFAAADHGRGGIGWRLQERELEAVKFVPCFPE
jgi:protein-L-isoaspartate O-methyltransferase